MNSEDSEVENEASVQFTYMFAITVVPRPEASRMTRLSSAEAEAALVPFFSGVNELAAGSDAQLGRHGPVLPQAQGGSRSYLHLVTARFAPDDSSMSALERAEILYETAWELFALYHPAWNATLKVASIPDYTAARCAVEAAQRSNFQWQVGFTGVSESEGRRCVGEVIASMCAADLYACSSSRSYTDAGQQWWVVRALSHDTDNQSIAKRIRRDLSLLPLEMAQVHFRPIVIAKPAQYVRTSLHTVDPVRRLELSKRRAVLAGRCCFSAVSR